MGESIAIIGIGCRFPGAVNPEAFWHLLHDGVDAITEVPPDLWDLEAFYDPTPVTAGKMNTCWGGFLKGVDRFDPAFFGISHREAERIDPQQRLLLEVVWEALENVGVVPSYLSGSQTGVFIGISNGDYGRLLAQDLASLNAYNGTGTAFCIAANRISYLLNLKGPSLAIDAACSSSLVAIHYACQSLLSGESDLCLAGGVNLILSPEATIIFSQARMMAADGRCKTFDASADGYVRGEGCGIVVLKRLEDALRDKDNIQAIIRGSAVNQDGLTNGLTAPNGPSQQAVIRQALENATVTPAQISYVEAHGTGTPLGDPQEFKSIKTVLMQGRKPEQPCWVGSVKTNIGHLESAAGIAGLIKVVLSLKHQKIPPHLHLKQLNPYISLEGTPFAIATECQPWLGNREPRLAGVSSFGFGGTNCHVILQEAPEENRGELLERSLHLLTLSARSEQALTELAQRYVTYLESYTDVSLGDICFTANTGRTPFEHRLAIVTQSIPQLRQQLEAFISGQETTGLMSGKITSRKSPKIAFLFTGQGSQYAEMGRQLYDTEPTFRQALDRCAEILRPHLDKPLLEILYPNIDESNENDQSKIQNLKSKIDETAYTQPSLFALEYALAQLWKSWGIEPTIVIGHSVGEYVAACVAGVFSLEDGLKLIAHRGRLMQSLPANGKMVSVLADETTVRAAIEPYQGKVAIAAFNGYQSIVISGESEAIAAITAGLEAEGIKTKSLVVSHAFHSPLMKPMIEEFKRVAQSISYSKPKTHLISNVTGELATEAIATPEYWCRHIREPVRFAVSMEALHQQAYEVFLEIGSKPVLLGMGRSCVPEQEQLWLPSLRQGREDWQQLLESLANLYIKGVAVNWSGFEGGYSYCRLPLPTYPFQRQRYWFKSADNDSQATAFPSPNSLPTPFLSLLNPGAIEQLAQQLETTGELSAEEKELLPRLLEKLLQQSQQQLKEASSVDRQEKTKLNQKLSQKQEKVLNREQLLTLKPEERQQRLKSYFSQVLAKVTGISATELDWQQQVSSLGIDSLMATELRKQIEIDLAVMVPVEYLAGLSLEQFFQQVVFLVEGKSSSNNLSSVDATPLGEESKTQGDLWFMRPNLNPQVRFRLFCFPYAGAGASIFRSWSKELPSEIELCSIQLPGRENRLTESSFTRLKSLIQTLTPLISPYLDLPFAFFGHSLGALLSFELARELRRQNLPCPRHLFVSSRPAPQIPDLERPIHSLPEPKFIEALGRLKGTPKEVLQDSELMQLYLPALRADFAMLATYFYVKEAPLDCPISAFGGLEDDKVNRQALEAWQDQTSSEFSLKILAGDHFFLHLSQKELLPAMVEKISKNLMYELA